MDALLNLREIARRLGPDQTALAYQGVELGPNTLDSLVTWDISLRAQREHDHMNCAYRAARARRGYSGTAEAR